MLGHNPAALARKPACLLSKQNTTLKLQPLVCHATAPVSCAAVSADCALVKHWGKRCVKGCALVARGKHTLTPFAVPNRTKGDILLAAMSSGIW